MRASWPQGRLPVGPPGDRFEREADRVADQVMRATPRDILSRRAPEIRRQVDLGTPRTTTAQTTTANPETQATAQRSPSEGQPMRAGERAFFEPRFGRSFRDVRIFDDSKAHRAAQALSARAFTLGPRIFFARGAYRPGTTPGRRLIAHELTHTLQQAGGPGVVQREFVIPPRHPDAEPRQLNEEEYQRAIEFNQRRLADPEVARIVEGLVATETDALVVDRAFIDRIVLLQAQYGLRQDGMVGEGTTRHLIRELRAGGARGEARTLDADLGRHLIRTYRARGVAALRRAATSVRAAGAAPPAGGPVMTAFRAAFRGRAWAGDRAHILRQIDAARRRLARIDIFIVRNAGELRQIRNVADRALARRAMPHLPAMNTPSLNAILLFQGWLNVRNLRTTRLIHEAFHGLPDRVPGGSGARNHIEHIRGHPWDNAFAFQLFVSELANVNFNRGVVTGAL